MFYCAVTLKVRLLHVSIKFGPECSFCDKCLTAGLKIIHVTRHVILLALPCNVTRDKDRDKTVKFHDNCLENFGRDRHSVCIS